MYGKVTKIFILFSLKFCHSRCRLMGIALQHVVWLHFRLEDLSRFPPLHFLSTLYCPNDSKMPKTSL